MEKILVLFSVPIFLIAVLLIAVFVLAHYSGDEPEMVNSLKGRSYTILVIASSMEEQTTWI